MQAAWAEMERAQRYGKAKAIGVSNYFQQHLEATLATAEIPPVVNQVEFHPYLQRQNLVPWAKSKGIATAAFRPVTLIGKHSRDRAMRFLYIVPVTTLYYILVYDFIDQYIMF